MSTTRKPWLAALLSVLLPGLGHLYNGRAFKSFILQIGVPLSMFALLWLVVVLPVTPVNVLLLLGLPAVLILVAVDAFRESRRLRDQPRPWYSRWWSCAAVWSLNAFVAGPIWEELLRDSWVQAATTPSSSMAPTILAGDRLFIDRASYGFRIPYAETVVQRRVPGRGDVVVLVSPHDGKRLLKRVIGLPGETVEGRNHTVQVDGKPLNEPYALLSDSSKAGAMANWGPVAVPPDRLFVLGDNRDTSFDSRHFGFLRTDAVLGRARVVYFSWDPKEQKPRWERIGYRVH